jgi:hypothetical protein
LDLNARFSTRAKTNMTRIHSRGPCPPALAGKNASA